MFLRHLWMLATSLVLLGFGPKGALGLSNVSLRVIPPAVQRGEHASLLCQYDLENEPLYSVKWYRGRHEFYRYSPSEQPATKIFAFPGIHVDLSLSNESLVVLRKVGFNLSGNFSCEVTVDATPISTKTVTEQMLVVSLPESAPVIMTDRDRYDPGEKLTANCTSPPSKPPASLSFLLNEVPGSSWLVNDLKQIVEDARSQTAHLKREVEGMRAELAARHSEIQELREDLAVRTDELEQLQRKNSLKLLGCPERDGESTDDLVADVAKKMGIKIRKEDIDRSFRSGPKHFKPRPITVNFVSYKKKEQVFRFKRRLKNTGFDVVEDLTSMRLELLSMCIRRFGPHNVWTDDGAIIVKRHRIKKRVANIRDFENI